MKHSFNPLFDALVPHEDAGAAKQPAGAERKAPEERLLFPKLARHPIDYLADTNGPSRDATRAALAEITDAMVGPIESDDGTGTGNIPAAFTYFGQFVFHDMVFSRLSRGSSGDVQAVNLEPPTLDLSGLYGRGPDIDRHLYDTGPDQFTPCRLPIGIARDNNAGGGDMACPAFKGGKPAGRDLPRIDGRGTLLEMAGPRGPCRPLIGDPRNDDSLVLAQLQATLMQVHNHLVDILLARGDSPHKAFEKVRDFMIATYRSVIVNDYLRRVLEPEVWAYLFAGPNCIGPGRANLRPLPDLSLEFTFGAARFGHAMVRRKYRINDVITHDFGDLSRLLRFASARPGGDVPIPARWVVDWRNFAEIGTAPNPQYARLISPFMAQEMAAHPRLTTDIDGKPRTIAFMDCLKSYLLGLPSGQRFAAEVAKALGRPSMPVLSGPAMLPTAACRARAGQRADALMAALHKWPAFLEQTPLFYYFIQEASVLGDDGKHLGPAGSYAVGATVAAAMPTCCGSNQCRTGVVPNTLAEWLGMAGPDAPPQAHLIAALDGKAMPNPSARSNRRTGLTSS